MRHQIQFALMSHQFDTQLRVVRDKEHENGRCAGRYAYSQSEA